MATNPQNNSREIGGLWDEVPPGQSTVSLTDKKEKMMINKAIQAERARAMKKRANQMMQKVGHVINHLDPDKVPKEHIQSLADMALVLDRLIKSMDRFGR